MRDGDYVIQQPGSNTNPTDSYRVVNMKSWLNHVHTGKPLAIDGSFKTHDEAADFRDKKNSESTS